jgi:hypothetical protein
MKYIDTDIVAEVRKNREELLADYGGIEGYLKHLDEDRPRLEREGWKFVDMEELLRKKHVSAVEHR